MKRLALAALLALGMHAMLFWVKMPWAETVPPVHQNRSVRMSLVSVQTVLQQPAPKVEASPAPPRPRPKPTPEKKPLPVPRPKPKPVKRPAPKPPVPVKPYETTVQERAAIEPLTPLEEAPPEPALTPADIADDANDAESSDLPASSTDNEHAAVTVSTPLYEINPPPDYPHLARRRQWQGTVILNVLVDKTGRVADINLAESSGHAVLDRSALADVKKWRFEPARKRGQAIEMWVQVPVRYELN